MTTQKHATTPYYAEGGTIYSADPEILSNKTPTNVVAYTHDDLIHRDTSECKANAAFIVRACNEYESNQARIADLEARDGDRLIEMQTLRDAHDELVKYLDDVAFTWANDENEELRGIAADAARLVAKARGEA